MSHPPVPPEPVRAFLDANVLFCAALGGQLRQLWLLGGVALVTSEYAAKEAWDNLRESAAAGEQPSRCLDDLEHLIGSVLIADLGRESESSPRSWTLPDPSDVPILAGAISARCRFLITGDRRCFGALYGQVIDGVTVLTPAEFIQRLMAS